MNENKTVIQHGFNGIKWDNDELTGNSAMRVIATSEGKGTNYKPVWFPFYNYTPIFTPSKYTYQKIVNDGLGYSRFAYKIQPLSDCGICYIDTAAKDEKGDSKDTWILLPPSSFTVNNKKYTLPKGYTIEIINGSYGDTKWNVFVGADVSITKGAAFIDAHREISYSVALNNLVHWDRFVYMGSYYSDDIKGNQDVWMIFTDAQ